MDGGQIFLVATLVTLGAFLWLLVTNPKAFIDLYKASEDANAKRAERVGKAGNWLLEAAKLFRKK